MEEKNIYFGGYFMKKNSFIFLIMTVILIFTGYSITKSGASYHRAGMKLFEKGEYSKAEDSLLKAVQENQLKSEYRIDYGFALIKTDQIEEAVSQFDQIILDKNNIVVKENNKKAYRGKGIAYYISGDYTKAIESFLKALEIKGDNKLNKDIKYYIASSYEKSGEYKEAVRQYEDILDEVKEKDGIYASLARNYYYMGDLDKGIQYYDKAIKEEKKTYEYYFEKYEILKEMEDEKGANEILIKAAKIKPRTKEDNYNVGKLCYLLEDYNNGKLKLEESVDKGITEGYYYLGEIYRLEGDNDLAITYYKEYLKRETSVKIPTIYNQLAACLMEDEDYEEALEVIHTGIEQDDLSISKELLYHQIVAYENLGRFKEAHKASKKYIKLYPEDQEMLRELEFIKTRLPK